MARNCVSHVVPFFATKLGIYHNTVIIKCWCNVRWTCCVPTQDLILYCQSHELRCCHGATHTATIDTLRELLTVRHKVPAADDLERMEPCVGFRITNSASATFVRPPTALSIAKIECWVCRRIHDSSEARTWSLTGPIRSPE